VTGNVITVSPDTAVTFSTNVNVTGALYSATGITSAGAVTASGAITATGNVVTSGALVVSSSGTPKVMQIWNSTTNSLDTLFL